MYFRVLLYSLFFALLASSEAEGQNVFFSANDDNSAFLCEDGRLFITGENNVGQLGTGSLIPSNVPVMVAGINGGALPRCKQVSLEGVTTFLALTYSGDTVLAWGPNDHGQVGDGTREKRLTPFIVKGVGGIGHLKNIKQIATGNATAYALTNDGKVLSWGGNASGETGTGTFTDPVYYPSYVLKGPGDTLKNVKAISGGGTFCMALLCDGTVCAWGKNHVGQLGQNNKTNSAYALPVKDKTGNGLLRNIKKIEAADNYSYALSDNDTLWVWGPNWDGRLGTGNKTDRLLPDYVRSVDGTGHLSGVVEIAGGQGVALALLSDKTVCSWGINDYGQLGRNDTIDSALPVKVKDPSGTGELKDINYIAVGDIHCIVRNDRNELYVWGGNPLGQLGLNDHVNRWLPVQLILPCEPTRDVFPGNGKMEYTPSVCVESNTGNIYITKYHSAIERWELSTDSFSTFTPVANTSFSQEYSNLTQKTYFRVVLNECGETFYSPVAVIEIDSLTRPGVVEPSASVRAHLNKDTLHLKNYKGNVLFWEYSKDNFVTDWQIIRSSEPSCVYSDLAVTTYFRAYVKRGNCPARYSEPAEIRIVDASVVKAYDGFTPNGDNINDEWIIDFIELYPDNRVEIYNRWGQLVCRINSYNNESNVWKGDSNTNGNEPLADDTYFYVINLGDGSAVMKGFVVINR